MGFRICSYLDLGAAWGRAQWVAVCPLKIGSFFPAVRFYDLVRKSRAEYGLMHRIYVISLPSVFPTILDCKRLKYQAKEFGFYL